MVNLVAHSRSMGKQKRHLLSLETSVDFELIGICSHHSDYRLTWGLNQELKLQLAKSDELFAITNKKGQMFPEPCFFFWFNPKNQMVFPRKKKKRGENSVLPNLNRTDFFLLF